MVRFVACLLIVSLSPAMAQEPDPVSLPRTESVEFSSDSLAEPLTLQIATPLFPVEDGTRIPVIYVLDADVMFGIVTESVRLMSFEGTPPPVIVVGLSYGGLNNWISRRRSDYHPAGPDGGGMEDFLDVIVDEVAPYIEANYPADTDSRILFGHSSGGLLALHAAIARPDEFLGIIASSPSLEEEADWTANLMAQDIDAHASRLFLSVGSEEAETRALIDAFSVHIAPAEGDMRYEVIDGMTHMAVIPSAFVQGIRYVLAPAD